MGLRKGVLGTPAYKEAGVYHTPPDGDRTRFGIDRKRLLHERGGTAGFTIKLLASREVASRDHA